MLHDCMVGVKWYIDMVWIRVTCYAIVLFIRNQYKRPAVSNLLNPKTHLVSLYWTCCIHVCNLTTVVSTYMQLGSQNVQ